MNSRVGALLVALGLLFGGVAIAAPAASAAPACPAMTHDCPR